MKRIIAAGLAALTLAGAIAPAVTASAQDRHDQRHDGDRHDGDRRDNNGNAVAAGLAGIAVGAAIANGNRGGYRGGYYYGEPRYAYDYYYGPNYRGQRHCRNYRYWDRSFNGYQNRTWCRR